MISGDTTVARLLDEHPELLEVLAGYHPHFKQLRNRLLRRIMAPRVTMAQAARMAGTPLDDLLAVLRIAVGEGPGAHPTLSSEGNETSEGEPPHALADVDDGRLVRLDVREDIRRGEEPFGRIMAAVKALAADEVLVLRAPFEPIPLYDILGTRGLAHWTERRTPDDWTVSFYRRPGAAPASRPSVSRPTTVAGRAGVLDVRGLEPPQPMVRVLEEIDRLNPGEELEVRHDRRPVFLYPQLDERGCAHETDEPEPGLVRIRIRKREA